MLIAVPCTTNTQVCMILLHRGVGATWQAAHSPGCMQGSATLSMAYAGALFADACLRGLNGEKDVAEYAYVESNVVPELSFFSTKVKLGPEGAHCLSACLVNGLYIRSRYQREWQGCIRIFTCSI